MVGGWSPPRRFLKQYRETCRMDLADGEEFKVVETTGGRQSPGGEQRAESTAAKKQLSPREEEEEEPPRQPNG